MKCNWQNAEKMRQRSGKDEPQPTSAPAALPEARRVSGRGVCRGRLRAGGGSSPQDDLVKKTAFLSNLPGTNGLLRPGLRLELLDHAVQPVLMRGSDSQKL